METLKIIYQIAEIMYEDFQHWFRADPRNGLLVIILILVLDLILIHYTNGMDQCRAIEKRTEILAAPRNVIIKVVGANYDETEEGAKKLRSVDVNVLIDNVENLF